MSTARLALCTFAVLAPLEHLMSVTVLWLAPATPRERSVLLAVAEGASAWASLDVFLVSAVAAVAQISRFAGFIVGNACDAIDAALAMVARLPRERFEIIGAQDLARLSAEHCVA
jgi:uncharacterized paraquat-inducible protein A